MISQTLYSSNSDEWFTPQGLFEELDKEFHFTLDPCSSKERNLCKKVYTIDDDGLKQDWGGRYAMLTHLIQRLICG